MTPDIKTAYFDFYGNRLCVDGPTPLIEEICMDFAYFTSGPASVAIQKLCNTRIIISAAAPESPAGARLIFNWKGCRVYLRSDGKRLVVYPQGASCLCDYASGAFELKTTDQPLSRELSYLLILYRAGETLDIKGFHRLHAGALACGKRPLLFCGARGAGKTTLLIELLKQPCFSLISDDTPLIGRNGTVYPFPLRLGIGRENPHFNAISGLRPFRRRYYPEKFLLDNWIPVPGKAEPVRGGFLFTLRKGIKPSFRELGKAAAWGELSKSLVLGLGVPQMGEYFIRLSPKQIFLKSGVVISRLKAARALINSSSLWEFETGPAPAANAA
ncbi:MAG: hypothetical protein AAB359_01245, partial [Elusimicrobiota bacterium]